MTATSLDALRTGLPVRNLSDEKMEQVRDLLVGDDLRHLATRLTTLETRLRTLETDVAQRMDAIQARIEAMSGEVSSDQRAAFDELAKGLTDLSTRVKSLSRI